MGRIERYSFFEEIAAKNRSNKIVTAHTLDDQAETMLLRLLRGSGVKGLIGIPYKRQQGKFQVVRPFLSTEKKAILTFLKENRLSYLQDKTNKDISFTRNRIRHRLLPARSSGVALAVSTGSSRCRSGSTTYAGGPASNSSWPPDCRTGPRQPAHSGSRIYPRVPAKKSPSTLPPVR